MKKKFAIVYLPFKRINKVKYFFKQLQTNSNYQNYSYYIFSDFGRSKKEIKSVSKVRKYLTSLKLNKKIFFEKKNIGTNKIFQKSLSIAFKKYMHVLIFEEDIIPNKYTLNYFENYFEIIDKNKSIGFITAHSLLNRNNYKKFNEIFLSKRVNLWSLGLSKKIYKKMIFGDKKLLDKCLKEKNFLKNFQNFDQSILNEVKKFYYKSKKINTDIKLQINSVLLNKYTITPRKSLVFNSGIDGSGERALVSNNNLINDTFHKNNNISFNLNAKKIKIDHRYEKIVKQKFSYGLIYELIKKFKYFAKTNN